MNDPRDVAEALDSLTECFVGIRNAICQPAVPWDTQHGWRVGDLTESMCYVGQEIDSNAEELSNIAAALHRIADSMEKDTDP